MSSLKKLLPVLPVLAAAVFAFNAKPATAADATEDMAEKAEKCATRLAISMIGERSDGATFDTLVKDAKFQERFARFANSQMNTAPGQKPSEDASYYFAKYVLVNDKPWSEMFVGKYDLQPMNAQQPNSDQLQVVDSPNGLGYFHTRAWMVRYAGNESAGIRIVTAYRMLQNTLGLTLTATTNAPDVDLSANGRKSAQCAGCHYNPWFALDSVSEVLGTRKGTNDQVTFDPPTGGAKSILGGVMISNDVELAQALVTNEAFDVNACRLAFKYLYGRAETSCEGPAFDQCVVDFKKDKKITSALRAVATDANFCE